jgi:hypothetical protein
LGPPFSGVDSSGYGLIVGLVFGVWAAEGLIEELIKVSRQLKGRETEALGGEKVSLGELRHVSTVAFFTRASGIESALCAVRGASWVRNVRRVGIRYYR